MPKQPISALFDESVTLSEESRNKHHALSDIARERGSLFTRSSPPRSSEKPHVTFKGVEQGCETSTAEVIGGGSYYNANTESLAQLGELINTRPLSCIMNFLSQVSREGISQKKLISAFNTFCHAMDINDMDLEVHIPNIRGIISGAASRMVWYQSLPWVIVAIIAIWLMVIARWFDWVLGVIYTVGVIIIAYIFGAIYGTIITNFIERQIREAFSNIGKIIGNAGRLASRTATAVGRAACRYTGECVALTSKTSVSREKLSGHKRGHASLISDTTESSSS